MASQCKSNSSARTLETSHFRSVYFKGTRLHLCIGAEKYTRVVCQRGRNCHLLPLWRPLGLRTREYARLRVYQSTPRAARQSMFQGLGLSPKGKFKLTQYRKMRGKLKKRPQVWSSGPQGMSAGRRTQKRRRAAALQSGQDAEIVRTRGAAMLRPYEVRGKAGQGEALKARALSAWVLRGIKERERLGAVRLRIHGCETSSRWVISTPSWASAKSVQRTMPCPVTLR